MKRLFGSLGLLALVVLALVAVGCGGGSKKSTNTASTGTSAKRSTGSNVQLTQGGNLTFAMVTHTDEGSFWPVGKKGAGAGAKAGGGKRPSGPAKQERTTG